jgi:potassium/sodium efflux P-type ATPase
MNTEFGKIAALTQTIEKEMSPLQKEMIFVTRVIAGIAIFMGIFFFLLGISLAGLSRIDAFIFAIGIIVANVPEGLLPTVTLALALAVQKMVSENALVKKLSSIETLGSCTVICTDKTGTLTKNEMTVKRVWVGREFEVSGTGYNPEGSLIGDDGRTLDLNKIDKNVEWLGIISSLCNNSRLKKNKEGYSIIGDPTEGALLVLSEKILSDSKSDEFRRLREIPFTSARKRMTVIVRGKDRKVYALTKGAPEILLDLCTHIQLDGRVEQLNENTRETILTKVEEYSNHAFRVMGFAFKNIEERANIFTLDAEEVESGLCFVGLAAMYDPPRPEVEEAVLKCRSAGIRIIMITGDHSLTAMSVARKIGIADENTKLINGIELDRMSDYDLREILKSGSCVFARVSPEHKLRIVSVLKDLDEIVAVTGDGVNDAPALKKADIGVAMGITGTDVAKEAADMILMDDNFATIVKAIEEGRAVFDNIRRFITYIFASNIPEIVPYLVFVLSGGKIPLPLTVLQILAVDVGTDLVPALALGTEAPERDVMKRPPRKREERLLTAGLFARAYGYLGIIEAIACMASYFYAYVRAVGSLCMPLAASGITYLRARTMCLASIITSQVGNGFACRTTRESIISKGFFTNKFYLWGIVTELVLINIFIYVPFFQRIFGHASLDLKDWLFLFIWPPIVLFADEARKFVVRKFLNKKKT